MTTEQRRVVRNLLCVQSLWFELHHGDCVGADAEVHEIAEAFGSVTIVSHPPKIDRLRARCVADEEREPLPYHVRNRAIVDESSLLIAAPKGPESVGSGTWQTVRYAWAQKKPVIVAWPDGQLSNPFGPLDYPPKAARDV